MNNYSMLDDTKHMFEWFADKPYELIFKDLTKAVNSMLGEVSVLSVIVTSKPDWLTGVKVKPNTPDKSIVTKAGVAFELDVEVEVLKSELDLDKNLYLLTGVFSWVGFNFNTDLKHLFWFELGTTLVTHGKEGELLSRLKNE